MLPLTFRCTHERPLAILCLGAHSDDIEIGAGGAILTLLEQFPNSRVRWVVFSANDEREAEARGSAESLLVQSATAEIDVHHFQDGFFPGELPRIKREFEALKPFAPDVVFTHYKGDHHQDHRVVAELTWNTFRSQLILEYEILKYDPDLGNPNVFIPLSPHNVEKKLTALSRHFVSQQQKRWFTEETFMAMMRIRGTQSASPSGLAEGFYASKLLMHG
jgi:LmbE family N-acetylglucosaminyl deacetylase